MSEHLSESESCADACQACRCTLGHAKQHGDHMPPLSPMRKGSRRRIGSAAAAAAQECLGGRVPLSLWNGMRHEQALRADCSRL